LAKQHPLDICRAREVAGVFRLFQPSALTVILRGFSALRVFAVALVPGITIIRKKKLFAVLAFAFSDACHWPDPPGPM
jgi:hypothetical protein